MVFSSSRRRLLGDGDGEVVEELGVAVAATDGDAVTVEIQLSML
jgi:hypothetical protein